jgi:uracil-DNA glycosylase
MATPSGNPIVYLEDLEPPTSQATVASTDEKSVAASSDRDENAKPNPALSTSSTTGKRQRTLFDMLGSTPGQSSEKKTKKPKLAASGSSDKNTVVGTQQSSGGSGLQSLNSIPFSLNEYVASLTEDQKRLLKLECETMGKSW